MACLLFYAKVYRIDIHGWLRINLVIVLSGLLFLVFIIICNDYSWTESVSSSIMTNQTSVWFIITLLPFFTFAVLYSTFYDWKNSHNFEINRMEQWKNNIKNVFCDTTDWNIHPDEDSFDLNKKILIFVSKFKENEYLHLLSLDVIKAFIVFLVCLSILCMINAILYYLSISKILDLGIVTFIPLPVLITHWNKKFNTFEA